MMKTKDGDWTTLRSNGPDLLGPLIVGAAFSGNDEVVLIRSDGTYLPIRLDKKMNPSVRTIPDFADAIVAVGVGQDGELRVLADSTGILHTWTGSKWVASSKPLSLEGERFIKARLGTKGGEGLIVGSLGSVFTTTEGDANWEKSHQLPLDGDVIEGGAFCSDGEGVFVTLAGKVWTLRTSSPAWTKAELAFEPRERADKGHAPAFSIDGRYGLVVGEDGSSVTITRDCGRTWTTPARVAVSSDAWVVPNEANATKELIRNGRAQSTYWHDRDARFATASASPYEPIFAGVTDDGDVYLLRPRPDLSNWRTRSAHDIQTSVGGMDVERDMEAFLGETIDSDGRRAPDQHPILDSIHFRLMLARGTALVFLLFLLNLLVGVQRYTQRLSAFWNSRADAIALHPTLTGGPSVDFDALVKSLAPDAYDFGPAPGSLLGRIVRGRH